MSSIRLNTSSATSSAADIRSLLSGLGTGKKANAASMGIVTISQEAQELVDELKAKRLKTFFNI